MWIRSSLVVLVIVSFLTAWRPGYSVVDAIPEGATIQAIQELEYWKQLALEKPSTFKELLMLNSVVDMSNAYLGDPYNTVVITFKIWRTLICIA